MSAAKKMHDETGQTDPAGSYLGMTIALAAWSMMFATIFISYFVLRGRQMMWPPAGLVELPLLLPVINTCLLFASSYFLLTANRALGRKTYSTFRWYLTMSIVTGFFFLGLQILLWYQVSASGIHLNTGVFGSVFYMMTWFHAIHLVGGLTALIHLAVRVPYRLSPEKGLIRARLIAAFWHFLVIVWVGIFLVIFII